MSAVSLTPPWENLPIATEELVERVLSWVMGDDGCQKTIWKEEIEGLFCSLTEGYPAGEPGWTLLSSIIEKIFFLLHVSPSQHITPKDILGLIRSRGSNITNRRQLQDENHSVLISPQGLIQDTWCLDLTITTFSGQHIFIYFLALMDHIRPACKTTFIMLTDFRQNGSDKENKSIRKCNGAFLGSKKKNKIKQKPNNMWDLKTWPSSHLIFLSPQRKPLQKWMVSLNTVRIKPTLKNWRIRSVTGLVWEKCIACSLSHSA